MVRGRSELASGLEKRSFLGNQFIGAVGPGKRMINQNFGEL